MIASSSGVGETSENPAIRTAGVVLDLLAETPSQPEQASSTATSQSQSNNDVNLQDPLTALDHSAEILARMDRQAEREASNAEKRKQWEANKAVSLSPAMSYKPCH
jgi:hypothetical protein